MVKSSIKITLGVLIIVATIGGYMWWRNLNYENQGQNLLQDFVESQLTNITIGTGVESSVECYPENSHQNRCLSIRYRVSPEACQEIYWQLVNQQNPSCQISTETRFTFRNRVVWFITEAVDGKQEKEILFFVE